jgi:ferritin
MGNEIKTSVIYKDMASFFDALNLNGFAAYFTEESQGENHHSELIEQYLADKQAQYTAPDVAYTHQKFPNVLALLKAYVEAEQQTTSDLYDIVSASLAAADFATFSWLTAPDTNEASEITSYALVPFQKIELKNAYDLKMEVERIIGSDGQIQGVGLNDIDRRLTEQLKG